MKLLNRKGFTLVELLATVTILSVIAVIAVVSIDKMLDAANVEECEAVVTTLKNATKEFASDKRYEEDLINMQYLDICHLINEGYIGGKIENPFTKADVDNGRITCKKYYIGTEFDSGANLIDVYVDEDFISCSDGVFFGS